MEKLSWKVLIPLLLIYSLFTYLRFYDIGHRAVFGWDQEQFSNQIARLVEDHKPSLLGQRVNNDNGFFLAPYFTYILTPFYLITGLNPEGMFIFQAFVNSAFFFLALAITSNLFSYRHALFFLFLWTISAMLVNLEIITWSPILIPPGVLLLWLLESKIYKNPQNTKLWALTGITAGLFMNMHFQFIFVLGQLGLFVLLLKTRDKKVTMGKFAILVGSFVIMFTPLFIFDLRNHFLNSQLFFNYFFIKNAIHTAQYFDWTLVLSLMLFPYIIVKSHIAGFVAIVALVLATLYLYRKTTGFKSLFYLTNLAMILFTPIAFTLLGMRPSEYYFLYLMPIFLITLVDIFLIKKVGHLLVGVCAVLLFINSPHLKAAIAPKYQNVRSKEEVVNYIKKQVGDKKFFISFDGPPSTDGGFLFLIRVHKLNASPDGRNPQIQVKSPPPEGSVSFGDYGVIIPETLKR